MGLSTLKPYEQKPQAKTVSSREFRAAEKGESWKFRLMGTIDQAMQLAQTPADFIALLKRWGYGVRWEAGRKSITYTTPEGQKCRDNKLHEAEYLKERMEIEFGLRAPERLEQRGYAGDEQVLPAGEPLDSERAVGLDGTAPDQKPDIAPGDFGKHGRAGDRGKHAPLLPGDEAILGGNSPGTAQPTAGNILTGWENERRIFQAGQGIGTLVDELAGAIPEENMEAPDHSDWSTDDYPDCVDDLATDDFEVEDEELSLRMRF
ncbi:MAG: hypothetical protein FWC27_01895 [Firmicutes bacterium]|nr:hypothetical protein [Bacillota bacterium]